MPGVVGITSQRPSEECQCLVRSMVRSMEHESFYTSGTYYVPEMGVYGGWVALEGSFAAGQVFFNEQKDIALLFAGECFPNPESQTRLRKDGDLPTEEKAGWLVHRSSSITFTAKDCRSGLRLSTSCLVV
jgi:asparagine synthase (glutamine-hydrolysing)